MRLPRLLPSAQAPARIKAGAGRLFLWYREKPLRRLGYTLVLLYALNVGRFLFLPWVWVLADSPPDSTAFMEYRQDQWEEAGKKKSLRWTWVPLSRISPNLRKAVVASEDGTFWEHEGFDWEGMENAVERNMAKGRFAFGGSTISQQLVKNLYFSPKKSVTRKLQEAIVTWRLEQSLSKERILEIYLNVVEWGDGIFGAEAAARHWFKTSAASLTPRQAAQLAAMLPSPLTRAPGGKYVQRQANIIERRMRGM